MIAKKSLIELLPYQWLARYFNTRRKNLRLVAQEFETLGEKKDHNVRICLVSNNFTCIVHFQEIHQALPQNTREDVESEL